MPPAAPARDFTRPLDFHVHLVGSGASGTGCWLRLGAWHRPLAAFMLRDIGMDGDAFDRNFDALYLAHLLRLLRESSLGGALLLAHDEVYDCNGRKLEGVGSFYVPNDRVLAIARQHPEFLPAVSIHPARPDALDELDRCLEPGAAAGRRGNKKTGPDNQRVAEWPGEFSIVQQQDQGDNRRRCELCRRRNLKKLQRTIRIPGGCPLPTC